MVDVVVEFGEAGGDLALAFLTQSLKFTLRERQLLDLFDEAIEVFGGEEAQVAILRDLLPHAQVGARHIVDANLMAQCPVTWIEVSGNADGNDVCVSGEVKQGVGIVNRAIDCERCDVSVVGFALAVPVGDVALRVALDKLAAVTLVLDEDGPVLVLTVRSSFASGRFPPFPPPLDSYADKALSISSLRGSCSSL